MRMQIVLHADYGDFTEFEGGEDHEGPGGREALMPFTQEQDGEGAPDQATFLRSPCSGSPPCAQLRCEIMAVFSALGLAVHDRCAGGGVACTAQEKSPEQLPALLQHGSRASMLSRCFKAHVL
jgi:hypothetical protein